MFYHLESDTVINNHSHTEQNWAIALWYKKCLYKHVLALSGFISWLKPIRNPNLMPVLVFGAEQLTSLLFTVFHSHTVSYCKYVLNRPNFLYLSPSVVSCSTMPAGILRQLEGEGAITLRSERAKEQKSKKISDSAQAEGPHWGWMKSLFACIAFLVTQH